MVATWETLDGRKIPVTELTDNHIINIFKHLYSMNYIPDLPVQEEASRRGLLSVIADEIKLRDRT